MRPALRSMAFHVLRLWWTPGQHLLRAACCGNKAYNVLREAISNHNIVHSTLRCYREVHSHAKGANSTMFMNICSTLGQFQGSSKVNLHHPLSDGAGWNIHSCMIIVCSTCIGNRSCMPHYHTLPHLPNPSSMIIIAQLSAHIFCLNSFTSQLVF